MRIAHPLEMKWWIRSWGPEVEVLSPEGLREEMKAEAERMGKIYGGAGFPESRGGGPRVP